MRATTLLLRSSPLALLALALLLAVWQPASARGHEANAVAVAAVVPVAGHAAHDAAGPAGHAASGCACAVACAVAPALPVLEVPRAEALQRAVVHCMGEGRVTAPEPRPPRG